jgi:hypothetical protein
MDPNTPPAAQEPPRLVKARRTFLCLHVNDFMRGRRFPDDYTGIFTHVDGAALSPHQARDYLIAQIARNRKVIPMSAQCGHPCPNADNGCSGFDYSGGGCPGFEVEILEPRQ